MNSRAPYVIGASYIALAVIIIAFPRVDWPRVAAFAVGVCLAALTGSLVYVNATNPRKGDK